MPNNWIVLTADRGTFEAGRIIAATEWDEYVLEADEVLYSPPAAADGSRVDAGWKVGGSVSLAADVYTYTAPDLDIQNNLAALQRSQIHRAYLFWRIFGRTEHWAGLRLKIMNEDGTAIDPDQRNAPLEATDQWAKHVVALIDLAINGIFPLAGPLSADDLQALIDHADNILRTLGPTWYGAQQQSDGRTTTEADNYRGMDVVDGADIYTDICTIAGVLRTIDGSWFPMGVTIRAGFNPSWLHWGADHDNSYSTHRPGNACPR